MEDFKTYMTGEFFALLSKKSILAGVVEENKNLSDEVNLKSFENGVTDGVKTNLLHGSFLVRTNHLLGKLSRQENYHYLSGLLLGNELMGVSEMNTSVILVCNDLLKTYYATALQKLGVKQFGYEDVGMATVRGHLIIYDLTTNRKAHP